MKELLRTLPVSRFFQILTSGVSFSRVTLWNHCATLHCMPLYIKFLSTFFHARFSLFSLTLCSNILTLNALTLPPLNEEKNEEVYPKELRRHFVRH